MTEKQYDANDLNSKVLKNDDLCISKQNIENNIDEWTPLNLGVKFKFRKYQKEEIIELIYNIVNHKCNNQICEAPTGSGKSLINIITACILNQYYNLTSYILVSDLFLWDQYDKFLKDTKTLHNVAILKGQTGNYVCAKNNEDMRTADCKLAGLSWGSLYDINKAREKGYECAAKCSYLKSRKKALRSDVCIMTYQLFLFTQNIAMCRDSHGEKIFKEHDVILCDEAHNIPGIVQQNYAPTVTKKDSDKLMLLYNPVKYADKMLGEGLTLMFDEKQDNDYIGNKKYTESELKENFDFCWKVWSNHETRLDEDYKCLNTYIDILESYADTVEDVVTTITDKKNRKEQLSKQDILLFKTCTWYKNYMCVWHDFLTAISETGTEYLLKEINNKNDGSISVSFRCTKEDFLVYKFLMSNSQYRIFVSATIGGKAPYDDNMGFKHLIKDGEDGISKMDIMPSTFDFEKSKIYFYNKFKMSYKEKETSFPHLKQIAYNICSKKFPNSKGIIQTGSYALAKQIYNDAPYEIQQRMLLYNGSKEKTSSIEFHKMSNDTILVGPTLVEGVDLPGDDCRFIVILKVPYPSLADKIVKAKIKLFPLWYNSTTSNAIIQGIGRGIRYDGDYCETYILDACFKQLYLSTTEQYSDEVKKRIIEF